jgi:antitoxin (DNA-binding transcriptional repressor) of toxin-antitoxin stability system
MKHQVVNVTEFKAKCLAMLEEIGENGGTITITKRGKPLATVRPARRAPWKSLEGAWIGKASFPANLQEIDTTDLWEALRDDPGNSK